MKIRLHPEVILSIDDISIITKAIRDNKILFKNLAVELGWSKSKLYYVIRGKGNAKKLLDHLEKQHNIVVPLTYENEISVVDSRVLTY